MVHFSAEIQTAMEEGAQEIVREKLQREICTVGKEEENAMRKDKHVASCAAMPDGKTVLLTAEYESEEACVVHINDEVMPFFEKLEAEKLLAEFDEECNADEHAENCKVAAISMAMYAIGADGRIGPCTFTHTRNSGAGENELIREIRKERKYLLLLLACTHVRNLTHVVVASFCCVTVNFYGQAACRLVPLVKEASMTR